ncbi:MAG: Rid family detoxifying hydrolase [Proteobacteria bacterium]|nr:Rid family detoxifying hydrolase [Pseudomonadota bacterium]
MRTIESSGAPAPVGPYAQAVVHAGVAYLAGQVPLDPSTGELVDGPIEAQAERVLLNLEAVLGAAGSGWERVLKVNVYLADLADFAAFNAVYARFLGDARPARSTYQVAALPLGARIEIDAIAAADS